MRIMIKLKYAIGLIAVAIIGCGAAVTAPTAPTTPAAPPEPTATTIVDGVWLVGSQVAAGTYSNAGGVTGESCYWARLSGFGGQLTEIIANGASMSPQIVTVRSSDVGFQSWDCGTWTRLG